MRSMELGIVASVTDRTIGIGDLGSAVEQAGLESLFLTEHTHVPASRPDVLQQEAHSQDAHILEQFTALGAAAAVTSHLKLGTGMCLVAQRDPIILAKQVATIDQLSGGRFLFGAGAGWLVEEMRNHGVEPRRRWDVMSEKLLAMKAIWTQDEAEFHGEFVSFDSIWLGPKPVQAPASAGSGRRKRAAQPASSRRTRGCMGANRLQHSGLPGPARTAQQAARGGRQACHRGDDIHLDR